MVEVAHVVSLIEYSMFHFNATKQEKSMLIRCHDGQVLNSDHIRTYVVDRAPQDQNWHSNLGGTRYEEPPQKFIVFVRMGDGQFFITDGLSETEAKQVLDNLLAAYADSVRVFDVTKQEN